MAKNEKHSDGDTRFPARFAWKKDPATRYLFAEIRRCIRIAWEYSGKPFDEAVGVESDPV